MNGAAIDRPKIWDRQLLMRRSRKKQIANRHMDSIGEGLQLLDRGLRVSGLPQGKFGEAVVQIFRALACTLARPGQKLRMDGRPRHGYLVVLYWTLRQDRMELPGIT